MAMIIPSLPFRQAGRNLGCLCYPCLVQYKALQGARSGIRPSKRPSDSALRLVRINKSVGKINNIKYVIFKILYFIYFIKNIIHVRNIIQN